MSEKLRDWCVSRWSAINFLLLISPTENSDLLKNLSCHVLLLICCFNAHNTPVRLCLYTVIFLFDWISAVPVRLGGEKTWPSALTH